jgi:hypothetical protein
MISQFVGCNTYDGVLAQVPLSFQHRTLHIDIPVLGSRHLALQEQLVMTPLTREAVQQNLEEHVVGQTRGSSLTGMLQSDRIRSEWSVFPRRIGGLHGPPLSPLLHQAFRLHDKNQSHSACSLSAIVQSTRAMHHPLHLPSASWQVASGEPCSLPTNTAFTKH